MTKLVGTLKPIHDKIMVCDMEFGAETTRSGILLNSDDGKGSGIHPRWARVYAVGPKQQDVKPGDWLMLEHGRWSRGIEFTTLDGEQLTIRLADKNAILLISDEKPSDVMRSQAYGAGSNMNFNIPGA